MSTQEMQDLLSSALQAMSPSLIISGSKPRLKESVLVHSAGVDITHIHRAIMKLSNLLDASHSTVNSAVACARIMPFTSEGRSVDGIVDGSIIAAYEDLFESKFHYDFTSINDFNIQFERGGYPYKRPCGWNRFAFKVLGKYENDDWLGSNVLMPRRNEYSSVGDEWPVSYHGTSFHNGLSIGEEGFKLSKGKRQLYGKGIYSTPDIDVAALYAQNFKYKGICYQVVLQNRVKPCKLKVIPKEVTESGEYWVSPDEEDIRPYGLCIRKKKS